MSDWLIADLVVWVVGYFACSPDWDFLALCGPLGAPYAFDD